MNHIVALSGGKDSTAMALALVEREPRDYQFVCTPTGRELPEMVAHWNKLEVLLGKPLIRVTNPVDLDGLIREFNALPNNRMRWCARMLKIVPYEAWVKALEGETISYVGLRADEEDRGGIYNSSVQQDFPFKRWGWGMAEVIQCLKDRGVTIPARTDCDNCYHQKLIEWWNLWKNYPDRWEEAKAHEARTGHTFRNPSRDTWPAALVDMQVRFEAGEIPKTRNMNKEGKCRTCTL